MGVYAVRRDGPKRPLLVVCFQKYKLSTHKGSIKMKKILLLTVFLGALGNLSIAKAAFVKAETDEDDNHTTITISFKKENEFKNDEIDKEYGEQGTSFSLAKVIHYDDDDLFRKVTKKELVSQIGRQIRLRLAGLSDLPDVSKTEGATSIEICFEDITKKNHLLILTECINALRGEEDDLGKIEITTNPRLNTGYSLTNYKQIGDEAIITKAEESLKAFNDAREKQFAQQRKEEEEVRDTRNTNHQQFLKNNKLMKIGKYQ